MTDQPKNQFKPGHLVDSDVTLNATAATKANEARTKRRIKSIDAIKAPPLGWKPNFSRTKE